VCVCARARARACVRACLWARNCYLKSDTIKVFISRVTKQVTKLSFSVNCTETKQQSSQWNNQEQSLGILQAIEKSVLAVIATLNLTH
jgi:stress response protein SCP2